MNVLMMKARLVLRILIGDVTSDNDEVDKHVEITSTFQEPPFFLKRSFNSFFFCPEKKKKKKKKNELRRVFRFSLRKRSESLKGRRRATDAISSILVRLLGTYTRNSILLSSSLYATPSKHGALHRLYSCTSKSNAKNVFWRSFPSTTRRHGRGG